MDVLQVLSHRGVEAVRLFLRGNYSASRKKASQAMATACILCLQMEHDSYRLYGVYTQMGKFSADEDAQLMQLVAEQGKRWTAIGEIVGRRPQDIRQRWDLYLAKTRITGGLAGCCALRASDCMSACHTSKANHLGVGGCTSGCRQVED